MQVPSRLDDVYPLYCIVPWLALTEILLEILCHFSSRLFEPSTIPEGCQPLFWSPPPINPWPTPPGVAGATVVVRAASPGAVHGMHPTGVGARTKWGHKFWCTVLCTYPTARFVTWELVCGVWVRYPALLRRIRPLYNLGKRNNSIHSTFE